MVYKVKRIIGLLLLICLSSKVFVSAQHNVYKIHDAVYPLYMDAFAHRYDSLYLPLTEKCIQTALELKDYKGVCIAATIPVIHLIQKEDKGALQKAVERCEELARQYGYLQYGYFARRSQIILDIRKRNHAEALIESERMLQDAQKENYYFGVYYGYLSAADIYLTLGCYKVAERFYMKAKDVIENHVTDQDPATVYEKLAALSINMQDYDKAIAYVNEGLKVARTETIREKLLGRRLSAYFFLKDMLSFDEHFGEFDELHKKLGKTSNANEIYATRSIQNAIIKRDFVTADSLCMIFDKSGKYWSGKYWEMVLEAKGDFRSAYYQMKSYYANKFRESYDMLDVMVDMTTRIIEQENIQKAEQVSKENIRLQLENAWLEMNRLRNESDLKAFDLQNSALRMQNDSLKMSAQQMRLEQLERENVLRMVELAGQKRESNLRIISLTVTIFLVLLLLLLALRSMRARKKGMEQLTVMNARLLVEKERAEAADRMKTSFIQHMNHEIRTPLNSIVGFSQVLTMDGEILDEETKAKFAELINHNSNLLTRLFDDVLELSEIDSQKVVVKKEPAYISALLNTLSNKYEGRSEKVSLIVESSFDDTQMVVTDGNRIVNMLDALLDNAFKFTEKGHVLLKAGVKDDKIVFCVEDDGVGVPADLAEAIFERFKKIDDFKQGVGLGLSVARMNAVCMGGRLYLDTSYTLGARFVLELPYEQG